MAKQQNKPSMMRFIVPLVAALVGALVVASLMSPNEPQPGADENEQAANTQTPGENEPTAGDKDRDPAADPDAPTNAPDATAEGENEGEGAGGDDLITTPETDAGEADGEAEAEDSDPPDALADLRPAFPDTPAALDEPDDLITLGGLAPATDEAPGYAIAARINPYRAAIYDLSMADEFHNVDREAHYKLLNPISFDRFDKQGKKTTNYPEAGTYAAQKIHINGRSVSLAQKDEGTGDWYGHWRVDAQSTDSVTLSLKLVAGPDDEPTDIARIVRTYSVSQRDQPANHTVRLRQRVVNLTDQPLTIQWEQLAQGGLYHATNDYLRGRSQQYVLGQFDLDYDEAKFSIYVEDGFLAEPDVISKLKDPDKDTKWKTVWPHPDIDNPETKQLAWLASENRYFVAISSAPTPAKDDLETGDITALQAIYPTVTTSIYPNQKLAPDAEDTDRKVILGLVSKELTLAPGKQSATDELSLDLFAGPREDDLFDAQPYKALHFDKTIRYSLGGMCGFCTFQWLANLLLGFLDLLHSGIWLIPGLADWGVAIVILVLVVRLILHPLTKRGQTNMMKMGKQMAAIQPELNKLKKKYADDPKQMQSAQMQLFREKGINPAAGALGCLPMFLQMPIWIALYAMLYYAIELRHEPAFYGVFQMFGNWPFLADLSSADRFIPLLADDGTHVLNLLFIRLDYSSINLLPILMGVTFFINMKFTTPPPMNEQQATQQKVMRIMPLLFPFFLYSAPAGLTLYIFASTLAGIVDSYIVRKHVKEMEESGELFKPKERKPGGMMDRLQKAAEAQATKAEELKKQQQQAKSKGPQSNYKKRKR